MALKISSAEFDLVTDAVDQLLERLLAKEVTLDHARTKLIGIIDLAALDDPTFMDAIQKLR